MKKKNWWKTAFDDRYLAAFGDIYSPQRGKSEISFLIRQLRIKKNARVLDIACGQGRHAIPLARQGMNVTGIDTSASLLRAAKERALQSGVKVSFLKRDMRVYRANSKYDFIFVLGNSFGYFSDKDNMKVLSNIADSLKTGGWLVLDLPNTPGMISHPTDGIWTQRIPNGKLITRMLGLDPKTFQIPMRWSILQNKVETSFDGMLRLYTLPEISYLLNELNLGIKKTYGSFSSEPYNIRTTRCLIMAQKTARQRFYR